MSGPADLGRAALEFVLCASEPLQTAATGPDSALALVELIGWDLSAVAGLSPGQLATAAGSVSTAVTAISQQLATAADGGTDLAAVADAMSKVAAAVADLSSFGAGWTPPTGLPANLPALFLQDLLGRLGILAAERYPPAVRSTLDLLGVFDYSDTPAIIHPDGTIIRSAGRQTRLDVDALGRLVTDPAAALLGRFGLAGKNRQPADAAADQVLPAVAALLRDLNLTAWYGDPGNAPPTLTPEQRQVLAHTLRVVWFQDLDVADTIATLDTAIALRDDGARREVLVVPTGSLNVSRAGQTWTAHAGLTGTIGGVAIRSDGVRFADGVPTQLRLDAGVDRPPGDVPLARLGAAAGPRFELAAASVAVFLQLGSAAPDFGCQVTLTGVRLVVGAPPGDGFLSSLLPAEGLTATCDLTLTWTPTAGLRLSGSAALDATLPLGIVLGPVSLDTAYLAIRATPDGVALLATVYATLRLGPVTAAVQRFGLRARIASAPAGGNLGGAQLDVGFEPPSGIALAIDAGPVSGGGFISAGPASDEYCGALELRMESLALKAVGLLNTRLPDGSGGYSLIVVIAADFDPVQLGFGFTLTGAGGLAGINRTVLVDRLRAGIRAHTVENLLFPTDPLKNPQQLLSDIAAVFPPAAGRYVFGPVVKLGWGTPTLLTLELALLLELPPPVRLQVIGRLTLGLPDTANPLVLVHMDALGDVEFATGRIAVDAALFDSRIGSFALTGAMALRAGWLGRPTFTLAIGGFNPRFQPPPGFPALDRLTLALAAGDNPRLRLEAYLALTSNTAQVGARLDLFVQAPFGISLEGQLSFDALFQFSPFQFVVDIAGSVTVKSNGTPVLTATVNVTLSGPNPWHVQGQATFVLFGFQAKVSFDTTIGTAQPQALPPPVQLATALEAALTNPANWAVALPTGADALLTLRAAPTAGHTPAHPLGRAAVRQHVLPLDIDVEVFGAGTPADPGTYSITGLTLGGAAAAYGAITDWFAPAQFLRMSDSDKLQRPSFEQFNAGAAVGATAIDHDRTPSPTIGAGYTTMVFDTLGAPPRMVTALPGPAAAAAAARTAAAVAHPAAPASARGRGRFPAPQLNLAVTRPGYVIATVDTLAAFTPASQGPAGTFAAAAQALRQHLGATPQDTGKLQIVASHEVH